MTRPTQPSIAPDGPRAAPGRPWLCRIGALALGACVWSAVAAPAGDAGRRAFEAVDPFIGTGGEGHTFPGATVPFGMIQLSPDTEIKPRKDAYGWAAGYRYSDSSIVGFSHTHFSGTGHSDLGDVLLMPIAGEVKLERGDSKVARSGYRSSFRHDDEVAQPGYYAVTLDDYKIRAELTASERVGVHRYRYPQGQAAHVLIDLRTSMYDYPGKVLWSRLRLRADGTVTGFRETRGWAPGRQLYFAMRFSRPVSGHSFNDTEADVVYKGFPPPGEKDPTRRAQIEGRQIVGSFDFKQAEGRDLIVKVAISPVSEDSAIANLDAEVPGFDFDGVRAQARETWSQALSAIDADAPEPMRKSFYTALYHTLMGPSLFMDSDGRYRGPDNAVHEAKGFRYHSTFSLWDTYRALHPLLTLVQPEQRNNDFVNSLLASRRDSPYGILPVWAFHGQETWCMVGYHAVPVIADAYMKGIRGYDTKEALDAMVASASYGPYDGIAQYMELGYVPIDEEGEAASKTLEYAFDDWTISRVAADMGRKDIAATFEKRAGNWKHAFDAKTGFMRARKRDGSFREPFDPTVSGYGSDYTEGNAWQYSWYVPQDVAGLTRSLGGDAKLVDKLDQVFDAKVDPKIFEHMEDITGLIGWYAHGNEPSHHVAYLYGYAGQPWRTQERLKQIMATQYAPRPDGLAGNDDLGQMSAWYVFTALGFYPVAPASNEYAIGRPFLPRATLNLPNGKRFSVIAEGLDEAHTYIGSATLNGQPLNRSFLRHEEIVAGGELRFTMQAQSNKQWASDPKLRPYSMSAGR
ncbi:MULTISPECIES: GH92 family glycosyl hydrolase [unclassified Lysobacter]|uniref:GH92 family glycosyl hydrolase n=1 Tax=unclassified Lysobacter TaxID=2635362 RepID=UPI001BEBB59E|nr:MULTISPECIES: GH92 family glycosyl hydrolase [unclassified Lysobacter]MBT2746221.1 GH92 family glycosyl hydrolase [Lysobacter sp. ISL-42]MBT2750765.1 GH92 family glycosyl hydrolase [Lysobacter sp. ISL-50]MBT2776088.1 GH92 family glycosyl hydrolase [Lysobacter sp. ISL-54]MBT2784594.1 GH92 family glycosyl hydrolase [Lysobacter sp. ISL-52]